MEEEKITLKNLVDELNYYGTLKSVRFSILGVQLYAEHYVNQLILTQIKELAWKEVKTYLSFPQKLKILEKMNCVNQDTKRILEMLNNIRDLFVHELTISSKEIEEHLKNSKLGFKYSWVAQDNAGKKEHFINLEEEYKKIPSKINQLIVSSSVIIGILYYNLNKLTNKNTEEFIDVLFQKDEKSNYFASLIVYQSDTFNSTSNP